MPCFKKLFCFYDAGHNDNTNTVMTLQHSHVPKFHFLPFPDVNFRVHRQHLPELPKLRVPSASGPGSFCFPPMPTCLR